MWVMTYLMLTLIMTMAIVVMMMAMSRLVVMMVASHLSFKGDAPLQLKKPYTITQIHKHKITQLHK